MNNAERRRETQRSLTFPVLVCCLWVVLLSCLYQWTMQKEREHTQDLARMQLRSLYGILVDTRAWNAMQGGVFVNETSKSPANPWLPQADRYLALPNGERLVKVNPAYMIRQIAEISTSNALFRISGKTPKRPQNISDAWESQGLDQYNSMHPAPSDPEEVFEMTSVEGVPHYRYLVALRAQKDCLRCHEDTLEGQVLGGISFSLPAAPLLDSLQSKARSDAMVFGIIGWVGIIGIGGASWQISRKRMQAEQANAAKSAFLANMSHDMRTPLHGILGMVDLAEKEDSKAALEHIRASAASLLNTVNGILDYSILGGERHVEQPFSLRASIGACVDAVRPACYSRRIAMELNILPSLPDFVLGDNYRFRQAVGNLLGNAAKYTIEGKVVVNVQGCVNNCGCLALQLEVCDTGPGVPEQARQDIFESFVQGPGVAHDARGSGLGLSIARQIARRMGGDVTLESRPGFGSVFLFTALLPLAENSLNTPEVDAPECREYASALFAEESTAFNAAPAPLFNCAAALDALDGKASLMLELCRLFRQEVTQRRGDLDMAVAEARWHDATGHVHAIKNSAATLSCTRLQQAGVVVESRLRHQQPFDSAAWNALLDDTLAAIWEYENTSQNRSY